MKRSSGNGKWWLLFVAVCGLALWYRLRHRGSSDEPAPAPTPPPIADTRPTEPPRADAATPAPPPPPIDTAPEVPAPTPRAAYESDWRLIRLSTDGKRAFLEEGQHVTRIHVVTIETGAIETDLDLSAYDADLHAHDDIVIDALARIRPALRGFPFGATYEYAATPDGTAGVYNDGDHLRVMRGDKLGAPFKTAAGYDPIALPDGKTVMFRTYHGRVDAKGAPDANGDGVYALAWATLDSTAVHEIDGTIDVTGPWAAPASADLLRIGVDVVGEPRRCIVELPLTRPYKVTRKRCLDGTDHNAYPQMSPSGEWVTWYAHADDGPWRARVMNVVTGETTLDVAIEAQFAPEVLVTDSGRAIVQTDADTIQFDPSTHARQPAKLESMLSRCLARGDHELVCEDHGSVTVVDLSR